VTGRRLTRTIAVYREADEGAAASRRAGNPAEARRQDDLVGASHARTQALETELS
jgi:hypothetical protein